MKIAFITTCSHNVGDDFVREGIRAVLDDLVLYEPYFIHKHAPETVGSPLPGDSPTPIRDKILDVDAVVQCGAPVYWNLGTLPRQQCFSEDWIQPLWYERIAAVCQRTPVLNIAAGACQRYTDDATSITADPQCRAFICDIHRFCSATTVRDRLAFDVLDNLGLQAPLLPCAAVHSWRRARNVPARNPRAIAVNFMPAGGHYDLDGRVDYQHWSQTFEEIVRLLIRRSWEPVFIAHDETEVNAIRGLFPDAYVHYSADYRDYFSFYGQCSGGILNRVHGAVLLAGAGVPAIAAGNDSRTRMMDELGLPRYHVSDTNASDLVDQLLALMHAPGMGRQLRDAEEAGWQRLRSIMASVLC